MDTLKLKVQSNGLTRYVDEALPNAYGLSAYNNLAESLREFEKAAEDYEKKADWLGYVAALNEVVRIRYETREFASGFEVVDRLLVRGPEKLGPDHILIGDLYFHYGELLYSSEDMAGALTVHHKALKIRLARTGEFSLEVAASYFALGNVSRFGDDDYQKAEDYFFQALRIWDKLLPPYSHVLAECYYSLAATQRLKGDFDRGIAFASQAVQIYERSPPADIHKLTNIYIAIANNYLHKNEYDAAIEYSNRAITLTSSTLGPEDDMLGYYHNTLGVTYQSKGDLDLANESFKKSLEINLKEPELNAGRIADNLINIGLGLDELKQWDSARSYYRKSLEIREGFYGKFHPRTIEAMLFLGEHFVLRNYYDSALSIYHQSLVQSIPEFSSSGAYDIPPKELINDNAQLSRIFKAKGDLLKKMYLLDPEKIDILKISLENYLHAQYTISLNRRSYETEGSKLFLAKEQKGIFENSLDCVYWLFNKSGDRHYRHLAFEFMEKSKSMLLLESLNNAEAFNLAGIPDSIRQMETDLKERMGELQFELGREKKLEIVSKPRIRELEEGIFRTSRKQDLLKELLQSSYPNYFEIKYNLDTIGFSGMQELLMERETTLVEFFWGDSAIYGLSIAGEQFAFTRIRSDRDYLGDVHQFLAEVSTIPSDLETDPARVEEFTQIGYRLYQKLLKPLISTDVPIKRLLVVGDGLLARIPFEALVSEEGKSYEDWFQLPYLLLEFPTSYSYSANLYFKNSTTGTRNWSNGLLAFSYSDQSAANVKTGSLEILRGMGYDELPGAAKELKAIASLMDGEFYWGEDATETNFKINAPGYGILHLAIHGEGGQDAFSETKLVFRNNQDTANDGSLHPHELYNMPLNARLVILSACETGMGKYYSGEGMFSMARAFAYSGNPSLISTFWKINDNTTYKLISTLCQNLIAGESVDRSLQTAKIVYLNNSIGAAAHPSNWAAFVAFGNTAPLDKQTSRSYVLLIVLALALLSGYLILKRNRKVIWRICLGQWCEIGRSSSLSN